MDRVTPHLAWREVLRGSGYDDRHEVPKVVRDRLIETADEMFEPIRLAWGAALRVVAGGGVRSPEMNERVGGALVSQHLLGRALDIKTTRPADLVGLYRMIARMQRDGEIPAGGLALYSTRGGVPRFVHVDCRGRRARWGYAALRRAEAWLQAVA